MKRSKNIYTASGGNRQISQKKVQRYGEFLERLAKLKGGKLAPHDIVRVARSEDCPIHDYFEWDDSKAANGYRIYQARNLLRIMEIVVRYKNEERTERMFFNVKIARNKQAYVQTQIIVENEDYRQQVIQKALDELISWKAKYKEYQELDKIFGVIEETQQELRV